VNCGLPSYDRESALSVQYCPAQLNGNKQCAGVKVALQNENASGLDENDKKEAREVGH